MSAGKDVQLIAEADQCLTAQSDMEANAKSIVLEGKHELTIKVGGNFVKVDQTGVTIQGTMVKINSGGVALSVSEYDIQDPVDAEEADDGTPGFLDRPKPRGGGKPRTRRGGNIHAPGSSLGTASGLTAQQYKDVVQARDEAKELLKKRLDDVNKWDDGTKAQSRKWFGSDDAATQKTMKDRIEKEISKLDSFDASNFAPAEPGTKPGTYTYVYPNKDDKIYLGDAFDGAPATGADSKAGTLAHEMSHYDSVGGTKDHAYGQPACQQLAQTNPVKAQENADSFEYFIEGQ